MIDQCEFDDGFYIILMVDGELVEVGFPYWNFGHTCSIVLYIKYIKI